MEENHEGTIDQVTRSEIGNVALKKTKKAKNFFFLRGHPIEIHVFQFFMSQ